MIPQKNLLSNTRPFCLQGTIKVFGMSLNMKVTGLWPRALTGEVAKDCGLKELTTTP